MKWKEQPNGDCRRRDSRFARCCDLVCPDLPKVLKEDLAQLRGPTMRKPPKWSKLWTDIPQPSDYIVGSYTTEQLERMNQVHGRRGTRISLGRRELHSAAHLRHEAASHGRAR
jgi:hypothetical protein